MKLLKKLKKLAKPAKNSLKTKKSPKPVKAVKKFPKKKNKIPKTTTKRKTVKKKIKLKKPQKKSKKPRMLEFEQTLMQQMVEEKKVIRPYPVVEGANNERVAMLIPLLKELVKKNIISDWRINLHYTKTASVYVERNFTIENEIASIKEDVYVTIYEKFADGTVGEAQLPIISSDAAVAKESIMHAKETCAYTKKGAFTMPDPVEDISFPQSYDQKLLESIFHGNPLHAPREMYNQVKATMTNITDVKMNSFEISASAGASRVINSNGIDISYHKTSVYTEFVLTCKDKDDEREFLMAKLGVSPEQLDIQGVLHTQVQIVRDATRAQPNVGFIGDVLFAGPSVTEFFAPFQDLNPIVLHTFAKLQYMGVSSLKFGQPIGHFIGELPTIASNPLLPLGVSTAPVDEEGTHLKPVEMIRNGIFTNYIATSRYAQYLNVPATGMISNIQVSAGATREQHLRGNNYFEIVSFSWFNPNAFSGDVAAEIRLGYHWVNGKKTAFRGGTFTGNIFKNILNARFSKEIFQQGSYYGPRAILFKGATITKME